MNEQPFTYNQDIIFSLFIRIQREQHNLSSKDLASATNINQSMLSEIEHHKYNPTAKTKDTLLDYFQCHHYQQDTTFNHIVPNMNKLFLYYLNGRKDAYEYFKSLIDFEDTELIHTNLLPFILQLNTYFSLMATEQHLIESAFNIMNQFNFCMEPSYLLRTTFLSLLYYRKQNNLTQLDSLTVQAEKALREFYITNDNDDYLVCALHYELIYDYIYLGKYHDADKHLISCKKRPTKTMSVA